MKQITMCVVSGIVGATFAMACSSAANNNANAETSIGVSKTIYEGSCTESVSYDIGYVEFSGYTITGEESISVWVNQYGVWLSSPIYVDESGEVILDCSDQVSWKLVVIK